MCPQKARFHPLRSAVFLLDKLMKKDKNTLIIRFLSRWPDFELELGWFRGTEAILNRQEGAHHGRR